MAEINISKDDIYAVHKNNIIELISVIHYMESVGKFDISEVIRQTGYKKSQIYHFRKLGERFSTIELSTYGISVLRETNSLPHEVVRQWIDSGKITVDMTVKNIKSMVKDYKASLNESNRR